MAEKPTTTIQIYKSDRAWLKKLFGEPVQVAFHQLITLCPHPENQRTYTSALISGDGEALTAESTITIHGFLCRACGIYVFPDPRAEE